MYTEEQFANILDEALALQKAGKSTADILAMFPEFQSELKDLLLLSENLNVEKLAQQHLEGVVARLPMDFIDPDSAKVSWLEKLSMKFTPKKLVLFGSAMLAVVLFVYAGSSFVISHLISASTVENTGCTGTCLNSLPVPTALTNVDAGLANKGESISGVRGLSPVDAQLHNPTIESYNSLRPIVSPEPPIDDTREFLKMNYGATIKTRKVEEVAGRVQTIVRGYGGRIDSSSIDNRYATIFFVVPKDQFDNFKREVKSLVGDRFYEEMIREDNMLPQKQVIEEQTTTAQGRQSDYEQQKDTLTAQHNATISSINRQIAIIRQQLATLASEVTDDPVRQQQISQEKNSLLQTLAALQRKMASENDNFTEQINSLNAQMDDVQNELSGLNKQNQELLNNVDTVSGAIVIHWISIPELLNLYVPYFWWWSPIIIAFLWLVWRRTFLSEKENKVEIV